MFKRMAANADVIVENYRPRVKHRLGIDYETHAQDQPAHRLRQHQRLRPGRAVRRPAGPRPGRAGHERPDVRHRAAGAGAGACRHRHRRLQRGHVLRGGIVIALLEREHTGEGAMGAYVAAAGARRDDRFPGCTLDRRARGAASRPATTTRPRFPPASIKTSDGHINIAASGQSCSSACARRSACRSSRRTRDYSRTPKSRSEKPRCRSTGSSRRRSRTRTSAEWIAALNKAGVPCGPIYKMNEVFADPQVQHLGTREAGHALQAGRHRSRRAGRQLSRARRSRCAARRRTSARKPTRYCASTATATPRSVRFHRKGVV